MNLLKEILEINKIEISDNPIINYLNYWDFGNNQYPTLEKEWGDLTDSEQEEQKERQDNWRADNELDVKWLKSQNADTIFSCWMPLKMVVQSLCYTYSGLSYYPFKCNKYRDKKSGRNIDFLNWISEQISNGTFEEKNPSLYKVLIDFFELASSRANVMELPNREMQKRSEWYDQMPKFLNECFKGGEFCKFFKNDEELKSWIKSQNLDMFFENDSLTKDNIIPLISRMKSSEFEWLSSEEELLEMIKNYNRILEERAARYISEN